MRVITFSRNFPAHHTRKGEPTHFVEKILMSMLDIGHISISKACEIGRELSLPGFQYIDELRKIDLQPKHHTIRAGHRWKEGDMFSPRYWGDDINPKSGRRGAYQSKQIEFVHPIEIVKTWPFEVDENGVCSLAGNYLLIDADIEKEIALHDGLSYKDWDDWIVQPCYKNRKPFIGQIICWNPEIDYNQMLSNINVDQCSIPTVNVH